MHPSPRIDTHQHYWHYDPAAYPWLDESMRDLRRDFTPEDAWREMHTAGFERSIAVQVRQSLEETRWLLTLADAHPFIAGVVGWVDLRSPTVDADLEAVAPHRKLIGVRHIVQAEPDGFLSSPDFRRGVARLDRHGLTYDILVYARQLPEALEFVRALPEQRIVLDHLGKPDIGGGSFESWRRHFAALA
jgi:L-fuconolactonase